MKFLYSFVSGLQKSSNIFKQTCSWNLHFCLRIYDHLLDTRHQRVKFIWITDLRFAYYAVTKKSLTQPFKFFSATQKYSINKRCGKWPGHVLNVLIFWKEFLFKKTFIEKFLIKSKMLANHLLYQSSMEMKISWLS